MSAVVLGHIVIDEVRTPDGQQLPPSLGGAGLYAALGAALVADRTALVSGVGEDFPASSFAELTAAGIATDGLVALHPFTPRTRILYTEDGERTEEPVHGLEHFTSLDPGLDMIPAAFNSAASLYVFDEINPELWAGLANLRARGGVSVLWEIHAGICQPRYWPEITDQLRQTDVLSINRTEARALCGTDDPLESVEIFREAGVRVVALRLGGSGAIVGGGAGLLLHAVPRPTDVVDPTGAGNAFSGAFAAALATNDLERALRAAMAAAALTIRVVGPPQIDTTARTEHRRLARETTVKHLSPNRTELR